jgi:uncharacterized protein (TIGR02757 family)
MVNHTQIKKILDAKVHQYNNVSFIANDPIAVPHRFTQKQDIEIAGFFAAILAWGHRTSIINNTNRIMHWMDDAPHHFILHHQSQDVKKMLGFAHRTFNTTDLLYTIQFLQHHYSHHQSLESAFATQLSTNSNVENVLIYFRNYFFSLPDAPDRTTKHIATPLKKSACKRLNMFLRWMVRKDNCGVDFGLWKSIKPAQLICPLDVHVGNVAHRLGLLPNAKSNWANAVALTNMLKLFDAQDPVKYDYALFSLGVIEKYN